jgi:lipid-binding SYLF domain-containing protein
VLVTLVTVPGLAAAGDPEKRLAERFEKYAKVLDELLPKVPDHEWRKARCVTVLVLGKGGFIVGGQGGGGAISCRGEGGGRWSAPVPLKAGGTTVGAQIGGAKVEIVMTWKNVDDIDAVARSTPVLQGSTQAAAGSAGAGASSGTNASAGAGVFTVSQGEGLYAGATFEGLAVDPDRDDIEVLYGRDTDLRKILVQRAVSAPEVARPFLEALGRRK